MVEISVMKIRQKSHTFDSEKVGRYINMVCLIIIIIIIIIIIFHRKTVCQMEGALFYDFYLLRNIFYHMYMYCR